ncbi:MAG: helix-turn-helix domain-containing protein [Chloroflexi bacterium]|nr:helix-turn-helix domain-containing protein [Chloroflexota bacterium]
MPIVIDGKTYYRTAEVCRIAGVSKSTFFRWLRQGSFIDVANFDRRGWRLFTKEDIKRLKSEVGQIKPVKEKQQEKNR